MRNYLWNSSPNDYFTFHKNIVFDKFDAIFNYRSI